MTIKNIVKSITCIYFILLQPNSDLLAQRVDTTDNRTSITDTLNIKKDTVKNNPIYHHWDSIGIIQLDKEVILNDYLNYRDPLNSINTISFGNNSQEDATIYFRGSNPKGSTVYLNGIPMNYYTKNSRLYEIGSKSLINPHTIGMIDIHAMNAPAQYHRNFGGAVDFKTISKLHKNELELNLNNIESDIHVGLKLNKKANHFIQLFGSYQNVFLYDFSISKLNLSDNNNFSFNSGMNYHIDINPTTSINLYSHYLRENHNMYHHPIIDKKNFHGINITHKTKNGSFNFNGKYENHSKYIEYSPSIFNTNIFYSDLFYKEEKNKYYLQFGIASEKFVSENNANPNYSSIIYKYLYLHPDNKRERSQPYFQYSQLLNKNLEISLGGKIIFHKTIKVLPNYHSQLKYKISPSNSIILGAGNYSGAVDMEFKGNLNKKSHQASLDYEFKQKKWAIRVGTYIKKDDIISRIYRLKYQYYTLLFEDYPVNLTTKGYEFSGNAKLLKKIKVEANFQDSREKYIIKDSLTVNGGQKFLRVRIDYEFQKIMNISLFYNNRVTHSLADIFSYSQIHSVDYDPFGLIKHAYKTLDVSIHKKLFKDRIAIYLNAYNIFNVKNTRPFTYTDNTMNVFFKERSFTGGIRYKIFK